MEKETQKTSWTNCLSCNINFNGNVDAFIEHMSENHADDKIGCVICREICDSGLEYSMHFIYNHVYNSEGPSESLQKDSCTVNEELFSCPACNYNTKIWLDFAKHLNDFHSIKSGNKDFNAPLTNDDEKSEKDEPSELCPVCFALFDAALLNAHVNAHFDESCDEQDTDYQLAVELANQEKEALKKAEEKEFRNLQKEYGMDEQGSYKQQGTKAFESAYNKGQITLGQLYNEKLRLQINQNAGVEDVNYGLKGLIEKVHELSRRCADILDTYTCTSVDFYGTSPADFGFGCGYRNIQMMISSLKQHEPYKKALFGTGPVQVPSIPKIQRLIEAAWSNGFDRPGCEQLNGKLANTKKWIGATEASVLLMSFKLRVGLIDFRSPTGPNGTHPSLLKWVYEYFKEKRSFTPPLYFQHQGHSRTIIGIERTRSGHFNLLLFDPSFGRTKMQKFSKTTDLNAVNMFRKSLADLKKPQFQIAYLKGVMESDSEFQKFKTTMDVTRIPP